MQPDKDVSPEEKGSKGESKVVKVKMLTVAVGIWGVYQPLQEYEMPADRAASFVKAGHATRV